MKKFISFLLLGSLMAALTAGCGNSESGTVESTSSGTENTSSAAADASEAGALEAGSEAEPQDIDEIVMAYYCNADPNQDELQKVEDAINEISEEQINVHVSLLPLSLGQWDQQINLMVSGNEQLDLMPTFFGGSTTLLSMKNSNQLMGISDLLDEYGQGILELVRPEYLATTTWDDEIYAVPIHRDIVPNFYINMRKDVLEDLGLLEDAQNISSMQDIEAILAAVKENTDLIPLAPSGETGVLNFANVLLTGEFEDAVFYDPLVDTYAVTLSTDPYTVVNLYETEEYKASVELIHDWFEKGYIHQDAATTTEANYSFVKNGTCFGFFSAGENATAGTSSQRCGYDMVMIKIYSQPVTTSNINQLDWVIPVTARQPEAAMKFMNLMYTNADVVNLLNYGIEGADYIVKEDGTLDYPEGVDVSSVKYSMNETWLFGNQYLAKCWTGLAPDTRETSLEINEQAELSPLVGFTVDTTNLTNEITNMTSAYNEYVRGFNSGVLDVETELPAFISKLQAGGSEDLIAEVQAQLDAWRAEQ